MLRVLSLADTTDTIYWTYYSAVELTSNIICWTNGKDNYNP